MTIRGTLLAIGAIFWLSAIVCWIRAPRERRLSREAVLFVLLGVPFLVAGWLFTGSNYPHEAVAATPPPVEVVVAPLPASAPVSADPPPPMAPVTMSPNYGEAVNAAQFAAVARYPQLGKAGSDFNTRFVAAYNRRRFEDPEFFYNPQWPLRLADEIAHDATASP